MHPAYTRGALYIMTPSSLKKRDNSVGSVGKSEKSPENSPRKVFQNAYTDYITYIDWLLEVDYWLDTVHEPDLRAGFSNRQLAIYSCFIGA